MPRLAKEPFKIGRKRVGTLCTWPDGRRALIVPRAPRDLFRGKNAYVSHALEAGEAMWSVESSLLCKMKMRGVELVGIQVRQTGEWYLSRLADWIRDSRVVHQRQRNGSAQRSLSIQRFVKREGKVTL